MYRRDARRKPLPWRTVAVLSCVGVAIYYATFNFALLYSSASQGALVQSSIPAMTALAATVMLGVWTTSTERPAANRLSEPPSTPATPALPRPTARSPHPTR